CDPEEEIQDFFFLTTQSHHRITSNHLLVAKPSILYRFLNQPGSLENFFQPLLLLPAIRLSATCNVTAC
ncbi:hypothetical protein, partial [Diaphorobacter caeni]|uniref:hypothetical protein n=1 Tax=Diaphorobacter caeni TaxID=2784387 RepID=UPI001E5FF2E1